MKRVVDIGGLDEVEAIPLYGIGYVPVDTPAPAAPIRIDPEDERLYRAGLLFFGSAVVLGIASVVEAALRGSEVKRNPRPRRVRRRRRGKKRGHV